MGKITSMHFAGWKMGLKTGMYYLRTMAASAPIQFTVDQEKLKVVDTNVAKALGAKKRQISGAYQAVASPQPQSTPVPRPMYEAKSIGNGVPKDVVTPATTPPPQPERQARKLERSTSAVVNPPFQADIDEGESPEVLALDGTNGVTPKGEDLPAPAFPEEEDVEKKVKQAEDDKDASEGREGDIYAEAVLACSIENPESCIMCSG